MFSGISLFQLSLICGSAISYHIEHDNLNWQSLDPSLLNKGTWLRIFCGLCSTHRGTRPQLFKDAKKIILMQQLLLGGLFLSPESPATRTDPKFIFACAHIKGVKVWIIEQGIEQSCLRYGWKGDSAVGFNYDRRDPGQFGLPTIPHG